MSVDRKKQLRTGMLREFGLEPLVGRQYLQATPKQRRGEKHKAKRRRKALAAADAVMMEWNASGGRLTEREAVQFALGVVPWWQLLVSWGLHALLSKVAAWVFRQLDVSAGQRG